MKIVFYSVILNHHQAPVADELWNLCKGEYRFVELMPPNEEINKGGRKYDDRPYLIRPWRSETEKTEAMQLAMTADVCVFGGDLSLPYQKARLKKNLLSFEAGERWLKRGYINLISPRLIKMIASYHLLGWRKKPLYKLCASAYAANDQYLLGTFKGKCFKWGYFTDVKQINVSELNDRKRKDETVLIMWCGRFIDWKHPEIVLRLAKEMKLEGLNVHFDLYGDGPMLKEMKTYAHVEGVEDIVSFYGICPNEFITTAMKEHHLFLMTSDRNEGWGAVANEAMGNGCTLIACREAGSIPFLINDGVNGMMYGKDDFKSLVAMVKRVVRDRGLRESMSEKGFKTIMEEWSPKLAANRLLELSQSLIAGANNISLDGPCSIAKPVKKGVIV